MVRTFFAEVDSNGKPPTTAQVLRHFVHHLRAEKDEHAFFRAYPHVLIICIKVTRILAEIYSKKNRFTNLFPVFLGLICNSSCTFGVCACLMMGVFHGNKQAANRHGDNQQTNNHSGFWVSGKAHHPGGHKTSGQQGG